MALVIMPPNAVFTRAQWVPPAQNQVNRSGWTGGRKVVRLPGAPRWRVSAALKPISREIDAWPWIAFFTALEGSANSFLMPWRACQPVANDPTVGPAGGAAGAETAELQGMPPNATFMYAGMGLTFTLPTGAQQLVVLKSNLVADANGRGIATFRAALRKPVAQGAAVAARFPVCQMALPSNDIPLPSDEGVYNIAFDAEEVFE